METWVRRNIIYETWPPLCTEKHKRKIEIVFLSPQSSEHDKNNEKAEEKLIESI